MVVVYGTVCRDRFHRVERLPEPGSYVDIDEESESVGGEAVNTALALLNWGVGAALCGNSPGTQGLANMLEVAGLDTRYLPKDEHFEPVCDVYVTPDGQRTMYGRGFREMQAWGDPGLAPFKESDWFTTDANHSETAVRAVELAKSAGMFVYLQDFVSLDGPTGNVWQSSTDWTARKGDKEFNVSWLNTWLDTRGGFGVLSDGANGFAAGGTWPDGATRDVRHYPSFPCPSMVDSTGAGDVFRAGMLFGLSQQWDVAETLRFASAAGSLNCRSLGAVAALPSMAEIQSLLSSNPEIAIDYE